MQCLQKIESKNFGQNQDSLIVYMLKAIITDLENPVFLNCQASFRIVTKDLTNNITSMVPHTPDDSSQFEPNEEKATLEESSTKLLLEEHVETKNVSPIMHVTFH